jgi:hypothetical protein
VSATPEQLTAQREAAYGPFQPGTVARDLRRENWQHGLKTCWQCLGGYKPHTGPTGRPRSLGRGRYFCSVACYQVWLREHPSTLLAHPERVRRIPEPAEIRAEMEAALAALDAVLSQGEGS